MSCDLLAWFAFVTVLGGSLGSPVCVMGSRLAPADTQRLGQYYDDEFSPGRLPSAPFSNPAIHLSHTQPPGEPYLAYGGITFLRRCASGLLTIARFGGRRCLLLSV